MLFVYVLPDGEVMNRWWYEWVIFHQFPRWCAKAFGSKRKRPRYILQDHEKALWAEEPMAAMDACGLTVLRSYPKCSQDLNPIETAWREMARLAETEPTQMETRAQFVRRVRKAVKWVNKHRAHLLDELCHDQRDRAKEVVQRKGSRTGF